MSVPANFATAVERAARGALVLWVEIEGLPYAYGNTSKDSTWFTPRAADERFEGIRPWFARESLPTIPPQELDHIEGVVAGGACEFDIEDVDGSLSALTASARTDQWLTFASGVSATATGSTDVNGSTSSWASSGVGYVGYETFAYSSKTSTALTISARGRYRSLAVPHDGGALLADTADNTQRRTLPGELVTPYARGLEGRRAWLYAGHSPASVSDCACIFAGQVEEVAFVGGALNTLRISCSQAYAELSQPLFADLGTFGADVREGADPPEFRLGAVVLLAGGGGVADDPTPPFSEGRTVQFAAPNGRYTTTETHAAAHRRFYEVNGDAFRLGSAFATDTDRAVYSVPGLWFKAAGEWGQYGGITTDVIREIVPVADVTDGPFAGNDHPLRALLCVLTSVGGNADNGAYDVLPRGFGLGIDASRIDVAGIAALADATPDLRVRFAVLEPVSDAGEWIRENLLKPFGFYLRASLENVLTVGRMSLPGPDVLADEVQIAHGDVVSYGGWLSDVRSIVGVVDWQAAPELTPDREIVPQVKLSQTLMRGGRLVRLDYPKSRRVTVSALSLGPQGRGSAGNPIRLSLVDQIAVRFGQPVALLDVTLGWRQIVREVGDWVSLTSAYVPSRDAAARGVTSQYWEVVSKKPDLRNMQVQLTLRASAAADQRLRYYAPAMLVASVSGTDVTVDQTAFVGAGANATDAFAVGDEVRAYPPDDWGQRSAAVTITNISGAVVTLSSAVASNGYVLLHDDYSAWDVASSSSAQNLAFRSDTVPTLTDAGMNLVSPHEHG